MDEDLGRAGIDRRTLIKRAAITGAVAWTAPVIIGSLTSPAAAFTGACTKHWTKITPSGTCFSACFGSGGGVSFNVSDAYWGGSCSQPGGCGDLGDGSTFMPSSVTTTLIGGTTFYKVVFTGGCGFSNQTDFQIGGRYGTSDPGDRYLKVAGTTCGSGGPGSGSDVGCFDSGTNTAWIRSTHTDGTQYTIHYIYLKYCCTSV